MKKVGVAILGLGVVGSGAYEILNRQREFFKKTQGVDITVECVLEPDTERVKTLCVPAEIVMTNIAEVVCNPDVTIVVEAIGGIDVAREYVLTALNAGKTVVTSNKELICKYSRELEKAARHQNAGLYFEASCVGGVPVIRTLVDGMQANRIETMLGIINGATNYILTKMSSEGSTYEAALQEAQALGYAEADPTADVEGFDAAYKLSILASLAFHTKVPFANVFREGICDVTPQDIADGKELGYVVKLLAIGKQTDAGIEVRVHPTFVKNGHPLAAVGDNFNAVHITGDSVGEIMLYGKGAGALPTGSAIVSDIIYAATHSENRYSAFINTKDEDKESFPSDFTSAYYLRVRASDKAGMLSKIMSLFAKYNISIEEMLQKGQGETATLIIITHETHEFAVRNAISKINALEVAAVESVLRVVS